MGKVIPKVHWALVCNNHPGDARGEAHRASLHLSEWGFTWRVGHESVPVPLNHPRGWIIRVELQVEDGKFLIKVATGWTGVGSGSVNGFVEQGQDLTALAATVDKPGMKLSSPGQLVLRITAKSVDPEQTAIDNAREESWWMG